MTRTNFSSLRHTIGPVFTLPSRFPLVGQPGQTDFDCDGQPDLDANGNQLFVTGTSVFITPSAVLTNAHNLFNRRQSPCPSGFNFRFIGGPTSTIVQPASFLSSGFVVNPFGTYQSSNRFIPLKYTKASARPFRRDIGLVVLNRHFTGGKTFMAMQLGKVSRVQITGYPGGFGDFPTIRSGTGNVVTRSSRYQTYDVNTSNGASGSPQIDPTTRRIVGLHNAGFWWPLCAGGPRWGGDNVNLLSQIFAIARANDQMTSPDGATAGMGGLPWPMVKDMTLSDPELLVELNELRLVNPEVDTQLPVARHVFQVIQGEYYEWQEYDVDPENPESAQFVHMSSPIDYWMPVTDAHALLSASRNWGDKYNVDPYSVENPEIADPLTEFITIDENPREVPVDDPDDFEDEVWINSLDDEQTPGDIDGDGRVNAADLGLLLAGWMQPGATDLNGDEQTDAADLGLLLANFSASN